MFSKSFLNYLYSCSNFSKLKINISLSTLKIILETTGWCILFFVSMKSKKEFIDYISPIIFLKFVVTMSNIIFFFRNEKQKQNTIICNLILFNKNIYFTIHRELNVYFLCGVMNMINYLFLFFEKEKRI